VSNNKLSSESAGFFKVYTYLPRFYLLQSICEEAEVDAKASLDTCEDEPPQPKPRKKKKCVKRRGNWIPCAYRLSVYAQSSQLLSCM